MSTLCKGLLLLIIAVVVATEVFVMQWYPSPSLGPPLCLLGGLPVYAPWRGVQWCWWWCAAWPSKFQWAGLAGGLVLLSLGSVWVWAVRTARPAGQGLATRQDLRQAQVLRSEGIVVGKQP